jgi:hypothetical protein
MAAMIAVVVLSTGKCCCTNKGTLQGPLLKQKADVITRASASLFRGIRWLDSSFQEPPWHQMLGHPWREW